MFRDSLRQFCPQIIWDYLRMAKFRLSKFNQKFEASDLSIYWTHRMAEELDRWGEGNVWNEIKLLAVNLRGKVLDFACGTGETMKLLSDLPNIDIYGFDISDYLIQKAIDKGIPEDHLKVYSALKTGYSDNHFDYCYSIGSLEHIPEADIAAVIAESYRIASRGSFHMVPVSRSGKDEGWIKTKQCYHNNSINWWLARFKAHYEVIYTVDSAWEDHFSTGKWMICFKYRD